MSTAVPSESVVVGRCLTALGKRTEESNDRRGMANRVRQTGRRSDGPMNKLILVRHGESVWNKENRFSGWIDVGLSEKGIGEAVNAARLLKKEGYTFDVAYTSVLKRAIKTLWIILEELDLMWIPVYRNWRMNERHYGALQGLDKAETVRLYGEEQVLPWRRSYDVRPPAITPDDDRFPGRDPRYASLLPNELPLTESLKDTMTRFLPYWKETIAPAIKAGQRVLVAPRQQPTGAGQISRPDRGRGDDRAQHSHGDSVG